MTADGGQPAALLLDVEGTTTPPAFVYEVLFPYSRSHLPRFVRESARTGALEPELRELERAAGRSLSREAAVSELVGLIESDSKVPVLKSIQGKIWSVAYRRGDVRGALYDDVAPALRRWRAQGVRLYIYSSGSTLSQRLLFEHSTAGDLTPLLAGYFDTGMGPKLESRSYAQIATRTGVRRHRILFVSDTAAELDAAQAAGLRTTLCARESDHVPSLDHPVIRSFDEL